MSVMYTDFKNRKVFFFLLLQNIPAPGGKFNERKCFGHNLGAVHHGDSAWNERLGNHARRR